MYRRAIPKLGNNKVAPKYRQVRNGKIGNLSRLYSTSAKPTRPIKSLRKGLSPRNPNKTSINIRDAAIPLYKTIKLSQKRHNSTISTRDSFDTVYKPNATVYKLGKSFKEYYEQEVSPRLAQCFLPKINIMGVNRIFRKSVQIENRRIMELEIVTPPINNQEFLEIMPIKCESPIINNNLYV